MFFKIAQKCGEIFGLILFENFVQELKKFAQSGHTAATTHSN